MTDVASTNGMGDQQYVTRLRVGGINDVLQKGWTGRELLDELIRIDYQLLEGITPDQEGVTEQWAPVLMDHPDTWRLLLNNNDDIVGYWHFVPLFSDFFNRAKQGRLFDLEITSDQVPYLEIPGWYDIYFVVIAILPAYRNCAANKALFLSLEKAIAQLAEHGTFIKNVCTNAYTSAGISLSKTLGLQFVCKHHDRGEIYAAPFDLVLKNGLFSRNRNLCEAYWKAWQGHGIDAESTGSPPYLRELDVAIAQVELAVRTCIQSALDDDRSLVPPNILPIVKERILKETKKDAAFNVAYYRTLEGTLEFFDLRDLQQTIVNKTLWPRFLTRFANQDALVTKFGQLAALRNAIRHSRNVDKIVQKEGEAAILWFNHVLSKSITNITSDNV